MVLESVIPLVHWEGIRSGLTWSPYGVIIWPQLRTECHKRLSSGCIPEGH
jgi:hypothetical protein